MKTCLAGSLNNQSRYPSPVPNFPPSPSTKSPKKELMISELRKKMESCTRDQLLQLLLAEKYPPEALYFTARTLAVERGLTRRFTFNWLIDLRKAKGDAAEMMGEQLPYDVIVSEIQKKYRFENGLPEKIVGSLLYKENYLVNPLTMKFLLLAVAAFCLLKILISVL